MSVTLFDGDESLEIKGESFYQENLSQIVREVGRRVHAVLVPEPDNPYDKNAVAVWVNGLQVGHLGREDAAVYQSPISRLQEEEGQPIALNGRLFGGERAESRVGIWLYHDPKDFAL